MFSFFTTSSIPSINAQTREPLSKSPSQLQAEQPQQQLEQQPSSTDTITTQASTSTCNSIPTQFPISNPTYPIQANSLQNALFNFKFADPKSGAPQAAETRSGEPQLQSAQFDAKGRIICASAVIIPIETEMPLWTNVGTLCTAIQNEWSSFLSKVSAHEQLHVNFIKTGFADYGNKIIGKTLQQAKTIFDNMAKKLQKQHNSIDPPTIPLNLNIDNIPDCKCPSAEEIVKGICVLKCTQGQQRCNGVDCINTNTNANCGSCGSPCGPNQFCETNAGTSTSKCVDKALGCSLLQKSLSTSNNDVTKGTTASATDNDISGIVCNDQCIDPNTNNENCGGCTTATENHACTGGQTCQSGSCQCPPGQFPDASGSSCVSSCGANEVPITDSTGHTTCVACPAGQTVCAPDGIPTCVDTNTDYRDCGSCGNECRQPPTFGFGRCESGSCNVGCFPGFTECDDPFNPNDDINICSDLLRDPNNCGACGNVCPEGNWCPAGKCCPIPDTSC